MKYIDIHSHVLPYIDDGARDAEMSLAMLRLAESEGISDIIVTPHYRKGHYKGERRQIEKVLSEMRDLMKQEGIHVNLYPGNEIYYHSELEEKLESGMISTMNSTEYVLVEFSPMEDFMYIRRAVDDLFSMGYIPIIAHVERIQCVEKSIERARELKRIGCDLQVNAASVVGETGFWCKRFVHKLLREELVDYIGTDAHDDKKRRPVIKKCADILYRKYNQVYVDEILFQNATTRLLMSKSDINK